MAERIYFGYGPRTPRKGGYGSYWYVPPSPIPIPAYSQAQVTAALHAGNRTERYGCYLLDPHNVRLRQIPMLDMDIDCQCDAPIQRSFGGMIREADAAGIDWTQHRIQPVFFLRMPDGGWYEAPLGVFLPSSPARDAGAMDGMIRIEGYDIPVILSEDRFLDVTVITAGSRYQDAIMTMIQQAGIERVIFEPTDAVLGHDVSYDIGVDRLTAVNELLAAIGYAAACANANGDIMCQRYVMPYERGTSHRYIDDQLSVLAPEITETLDIFGAPNVFVGRVQLTDAPALVSRYINDNPLSRLSTVTRGRRVVTVIDLDAMEDQEALDAYVRREAYKAEAQYGSVAFETLAMPGHGVHDIVYLQHQRGGIAGRFMEAAWSLTLKAGSRMRHEVTRVVIL